MRVHLTGGPRQTGDQDDRDRAGCRPEDRIFRQQKHSGTLCSCTEDGRGVPRECKGRAVTSALQIEKLTLGEKLTQQVAADLKQADYQVEILSNLTRDKHYPDDIDLQAINTTADAILHLQLNDVGIYSGLFSGTYAPRVSLYEIMQAKGRKRALYKEEIHYGAHAEKGKDWAVEADPRFSYTGADDIIQKSDEIKVVFATGSAAVGKRMTEQVLARIR